jgi:hypothetical protein
VLQPPWKNEYSYRFHDLPLDAERQTFQRPKEFSAAETMSSN